MFESAIKSIAKHHNVFIVVNLTTDSETVIDYYNSLDTDPTISNELSGLDVVDDLEAEFNEVISVNNDFIVYSHDLHTCRMAGCYSVVGDTIDEETLPKAYVFKAVREILNITDKSLNISNLNNYLTVIENKNNTATQVYNYKSSKFEKPINMTKLKNILIPTTCLIC